jgi:hypothetical protein
MHTSEDYTGWYYYETEGQQADLPTLKKQFRTDYIEFENWQYNDVDSAFYTAEVKTKKEFSGTVHWGVYEDSTVMYDLEFYDYIIGPIVAPPTNKAVYQKRDDGYRVKVAFTPEQLLFLKRSKVHAQKLNIVVFDQDVSGKTLHTLTTDYNWGEVKSFPTLPLDPPLTIDVSDTYTDYESSAWLQLYYFEGGSWKTVAPYDNRIRFYQPYYNISWEAQELSRTEVLIGKHQLYYYNELGLLFFPQSNHWIHTDYDLEQLKNVTTIEFNDGSIAFYNSLSFMQNPYGHGPCGACDHEQTDIYLIGEKGPQLILSADVNMGNLVCIWREHDIELAEEWIPEFGKQRWNRELEQLTVPVYNERGESTTPKNMLISWDKEWKPVIELVDR